MSKLAEDAYREITTCWDYDLTADAFKMRASAMEVREISTKVAQGEARDPGFAAETMKVATKFVTAAEAVLGRSEHDGKVLASIAGLDMAMRHIGLPITDEDCFLARMAAEAARPLP